MPAKRPAPSSHRRMPAAKHQKVVTRVVTSRIGDYDPQQDGLNAAQQSAQQLSSSVLSVRSPRTSNSSLVRLCLVRFAQSLPELLGGKSNERSRLDTHRWLTRLPPHLAKGLFVQLRLYHPDMLNNTFISNYLLQGEAVIFTGDMTSVNAETLRLIRESPSVGSIHTLELRDQPDLKDLDVARLLGAMPSLVTLSLRGCAKVGEAAVYAAAESCRLLEVVNLNYTIATAASLTRLMQKCEKIHTLKVAGLSSMNNVTINDFGWKYRHQLRKLKLRQTRVTDADAVLELLDPENPLSLDISFTSFFLPVLPPSTVKLVMTSTPIPPKVLAGLLQPLTRLRKLSLAALGGLTQTFGDSVLRSIIPHLVAMEGLIELNLAGNSKLGLNGTGGVADMLSVIGHRLEVLNISAIPRLRSRDLEPFSEMADTPRLRVLSVKHTGIDDDAAPYIAACRNLEFLNLSSTAVSTEAVGVIVDSCPELTELDLTGCRGVEVLDRRRFFEAWEERKAQEERDRDPLFGKPPKPPRGRRPRNSR